MVLYICNQEKGTKNMAFISAEDVKHIRNELKKELPQYKFSVVRDHHSSVTISLMKASFKDFEYFDRYAQETKVGTLNEGHHQINQFHLRTSTEKKMRKSWTRFMLSQKTVNLLRMVEKSGTTTQIFKLTTLTLLLHPH